MVLRLVHALQFLGGTVETVLSLFTVPIQYMWLENKNLPSQQVSQLVMLV
jgi:hypothetical protein